MYIYYWLLLIPIVLILVLLFVSCVWFRISKLHWSMHLKSIIWQLLKLCLLEMLIRKGSPRLSMLSSLCIINYFNIIVSIFRRYLIGVISHLTPRHYWNGCRLFLYVHLLLPSFQKIPNSTNCAIFITKRWKQTKPKTIKLFIAMW